MNKHLWTAVLEAADFIEQNPDRHDFFSGGGAFSRGETDKGCALLWIGRFLGVDHTPNEEDCRAYYEFIAEEYFHSNSWDMHDAFYGPDREVFSPAEVAQNMRNWVTKQRVTAIRAAADFIDAHPLQYDFHTTRVPTDTDGVACAIGWVGYFAGESGRPFVGDIARRLFGASDMSVYIAASVYSRDQGIDGNFLCQGVRVGEVLRHFATELGAGRGIE